MQRTFFRISYCLVAIIFFTSCATTKTVVVEPVIKKASIRIVHSNDARNNIIDSNVNVAIETFNNTSKFLKLALDTVSNSQNLITINFADAKFVSNAGVIASYVISALGLIASPIITYQSSDKKWLLFFYYFALDRTSFDAKYSNWQTEKNLPTRTFYAATDAIFYGKIKRRENLSKQIQAQLVRYFQIVERKIK